MAVEIDILNLERAIGGLSATLRETSERSECIQESLASIADSLALLAERFCTRPARARKSRKTPLKVATG